MPYGSARDLPSVVEASRQLAAVRWLQYLLPRAKRPNVKDLRKQLDRTIDTADGFYALLGPRHWVFHDDLNLERMAEIISECDDGDSAEAALIAYYQNEDILRFWVRHLCKRPAMRSRRRLIEHALDDYFSGRYYAVVHVLLSVMDGYVNDTDVQLRKGLHAREPEEVDAWDSVVGHHLGLAHAHETFRKGFRATDESETFELYRNGIVHGTLTNYDNVVVATKAWNRLFAVVDWSRSEEKRKAPVEAMPTFGEAMKSFTDLAVSAAETKRRFDAFRPSVLCGEDGMLFEHAAYVACSNFLMLWQKSNYGHMSKALAKSAKQSPQDVRNNYKDYKLNQYEILSLDQYALAACSISVKLIINDVEHEHTLRLIREDEEGEISWADIDWRVMAFGPQSMMNS